VCWSAKLQDILVIWAEPNLWKGQVSYDRLQSAATLYLTLQELRRRLAIPALRRKNLEYFAFVINRTPEIARLAVDPYEDLVQMPAPLGKRPMMNTPLPDLHGKLRAEPVPPKLHGLVANIDATLEQKIFNLPKRQWVEDIHNYHHANVPGMDCESAEARSARQKA
jgi:hypothetical protein